MGTYTVFPHIKIQFSIEKIIEFLKLKVLFKKLINQYRSFLCWYASAKPLLVLTGDLSINY